MRYEDASQSGSFQDIGPVARDDADQLAVGDRGPATGNLISGAGTQTGAAGADSGAGARVSSIAGAGGQDTTFAGGQLRVEGEHGSLSVTARGDYVYRPAASVPENGRDVFNYTLSDAAGQSSQARLIIEIGKTRAVVAANAQRIVPGPDGVVVLPSGVELSDIRIVGRDLLILLPDGSQMVIVDGAVFVPQLVINDIEVPSTNLAALLIEQEPRPASGVPQSSGGNFANPVGPLDPGTPLGNLLPPTQLVYTPPEFREVGRDEDRRPVVGANAPIQLDDDVRTGCNAGGVGDDPDAVNRSGTLSGSGGDGRLTFALSAAGAPAGFTYAVQPNGSLLVQQNGVTVLTVTVNAQTGAYSVTQNAPVVHAAGANENNVVFTFGYTVTDRDGDSATGSFQVNVDDDTPVVDVAAGADAGVTLTTDDADARGDLSDAASSSANFGGVFSVTQSAGADGLGSASLTFALSTTGGASGLTQGGQGINLYLIGGKVVGSTAASIAAVTAANTVFDVSVNGTGVVTLTQYSQIDHSAEAFTTSPFSDQLVALADNAVTLVATATNSDRDGDSASDSASVAIGANLRFSDDGPSIGSVAAGASVSLDETEAGFPISATSASAVIVAAGANFGADGQAASGAATYAITVVGGGATPLRTAQGDLPITLTQTSGSVITGTFVEGGVTRIAFTLTINADGSLTVRQSVPLEHGLDGSTAAAFDDVLNLTGLINATVTLTDRDGDTASATTGIGTLVSFRDDGPDSSLAVGAARDVLVFDETLPVGSDTAGGLAPAGLASVTAAFADNFAAAAFGADGEGSVAYSLVLNGSNVASGLYALDASDRTSSDGDGIGRGAEILLNQSGNVVTGSVGGVAAFTIAIDPATGAITFTQLAAVWHPTGEASFDEAAVLRLAEGMLLVRQTVTDGDGDSDTASIDIGQGQFQIQDDGPVARADLDLLAAGTFGPETGNVLTGAGTSGGAAGADTLGRDGAALIAVRSGESRDSSFDEAGNLVIHGQFGVLTTRDDGSYSYLRDSGTRGGVEDVFTYTLRDTDGDVSESSLTIRIGDLPPTLTVPGADAPGTSVDEAGLAARGEEPQGSREEAAPGDSSETTSGTISFTPGDGPATVTINDEVVTGPGQVIDTGKGLLTIDSFSQGAIVYRYTLKDNLLEGQGGSDAIRVVVTDQDGGSVDRTLVIAVRDDAPEARDDSDALAAGSFGPETGNVLTGAGTVSGEMGRDTVGADNAALVSVRSSGASTDNEFDSIGNLAVAGQYGILTIRADGSYSYVRNAGSPGGVSDVFTYTVRDGDGDESTAELVIAIGNSSTELNILPAGGETTTVNEAGLPPRGTEPAGSGELADGDPGNSSDNREAVSGSFTFEAKDGLAALVIGGVTLTAGSTFPVSINSPGVPGTLQITGVSYDSATGLGTVQYSFFLGDNLLGDQAVNGGALDVGFPVTVRDTDGDSSDGTLSIRVRDDLADARADTDSLAAGSLGPVTGNVISGAGTDSGALGRDVPGADGASLVAVSGFDGSDSDFDASGDLVVNGQYGVLTIRADGSYSYSRNAGTPGGVSDVFTYRLRDGDGDEDSATLTIAISDAAPVTGANAAAGSDDDALPGGNAGGTGDDADGVNLTGFLAASGGDGPLTFALNGISVVGATGFNSMIGADGSAVITQFGVPVFTVSINPETGAYIIVQVGTWDHAPSGEENNISFTIGYQVTDQDGDRATGTLTYSLDDDTPVATSDIDSVGSSTNRATGNVLTGVDSAGGDSNGSDGNADSPGADGGSVVSIAYGQSSDSSFDADGNLLLAGQHGTLTMKADGSYSYVRSSSGPLNASDVFTYTPRDGDGDEVTATLTVTISDDGVVIDIPPAGGATTRVFEAALGARGSEPEGSGEAEAPGDNGDMREAVSGSIGFSAKDGLGSISLGGQTLTGSFPQTVASSATGTLVVTGVTFDAATGTGSIAYTYTLADNTNAASAPPSFALVVTDSDGDQSQGNLVIAIVDDAPTARADSDGVVEGANTGGNVLTGTGTSSGPAGADTQGADGAVVVGVRAGNDPSTPALSQIGTQVAGLYGTLTLNADGSYSYAANPNSVTASQVDVFTYTIRDGDGDVSTTTLTITVANVTLIADSEVASVSEAALDLVRDGADLAAGLVTGSHPESEAETTSGQLVIPGAVQFVILGSTTGSRGLLSIDSATGAYTYTLTSPATTSPAADDGTAVGGFETFTYVATDANGNSVTGTIRIDIVDDVSTARDDSDAVAEGLGNVADGNVLTGNGGGDQNGSDGAADVAGADGGATVVGARSGGEAASGSFTSVPGGSGSLVLTGTYGDLLIRADGSYSYTLKVAEIPAGVTGERFTYQMRDRDGDLDEAQLSISFNADTRVPRVTNAAGTVFEDGLADGNQHGANSETVSGSFQVDLKGETGSVTIGGVAVTNGASFDTGEGVLTITAVSTAGTVTTYSYSYTLKAPLTHVGQGEINPLLDTILVNVTDATGDNASGTIGISIVDDVPTAAFDSDSLAAGSFGPATGNVISGLGTTTGLAGRDTVGADGATVVGVKAGVDPAPATSGTATVIKGLYGKLTLQSNGDYSYTRDPNTAGGVTDSFSYTLADGDGDTAVAQLDIVIGNAPVVVDIPPAGGATTRVFEAALGARGSEPEGSGEAEAPGDNGDMREAVSGSIGFSAKDGLGSISLGGQTLTGSFPQTVASNATDTLVVTGVTFDAATGTGSIAYTYTLADNTNAASAPPSFALVVTDSDGDQSQGNLVIAIVDDAPTARNDTVNQAAENASITFGAFGNDTFGADGVDTGNIARVTFTNPAQGGLSYNPANGQFTFVPVAGQTGDVTFTYTIEDGDGDTSTATVTLRLTPDSVPVPSDAAARIDDEGLASGNPGGVGDIDANAGDLVPGSSEAVFAGRIIVNFGGDSADSTIGFSNLNGMTGMVGTEAVTYSWNSVTNVLTASSAGRGDVFQVTVNPATGDYTVTLLQNVLHAAGGNETSTFVDLFYRAVDGDGDAATIGKLVIEFNDDTPSAFSPASVTTVNGNSPAVTGWLNLDMGADGLGSLAFAPELNGQVVRDQAGNVLTVGGQQLVYAVNGSVLTAQTATGVVGYGVTLNPNGSYSFDVQALLSNGTDTTFGNLTSARAGNDDFRGIGANAGSAGTVDILLSASRSNNAAATVNTNADSIGVANQSLGNGDSVRIDFVTNLTTGASTPSGFNYGAHVGTNRFVQTVPEVQGDQDRTVSFQVYALNTTNTSAVEPDRSPNNGFSDSTLVGITAVRVFNFADGAASPLLALTAADVNVARAVGFGISVTLQSDGSVVFTGIQQGDRYEIQTGNNEFEAVVVEHLSGGFDLGVFTIGAVAASAPTVQVLPVIASDADGDSVSSTITATINPAGSVTTASAGTTSSTTMQSASVMLAADEGGSSSNGNRNNGANNNLALMAGLAAGMPAMPAAASTDGSSFSGQDSKSTEGGQIQETRQAPESGSTGRGEGLATQGQEDQLLPAETVELAAQDRGGEIADFNAAEGEEQDSLSALDSGTEAAQPAETAALFGGGEIQLPAPDQMAALASQAGGQHGDPVQTNPALEAVLADALSGGGLADVDIDRMIDAAISLAGPNQRQPGEMVGVIDAAGGQSGLASPLSGAVSSWDGGHFGLLFTGQAQAMDMQAQHADAVHAIANG